MKITVEYYNDKWAWEGSDDITLYGSDIDPNDQGILHVLQQLIKDIGYNFDGNLTIGY